MKYTHKKVGSVIEIFRDNVKVADYNPVDEEIKFVKKDFAKYEPEVQKVIDGLTDDSDSDETGATPTDKTDPPADETGDTPTELSDAEKIAKLETEVEILQGRVAQLETEVEILQGRVAQLETEVEILQGRVAQLTRVNQDLEIQLKQAQTGSDTKPVPERFSDTVSMADAPEQDRMLGDLTPAFVKWAKKNWSPEIFEKRYRGRIKNLNNV
jgi:outer membrane murein-binding lipoprotein Lpp